MIFKLKYCLLLLGSLVSTLGTAQNSTSVHGKVVDAATKETLAYATVQFQEGNIGTRTDLDGNFYLKSPKLLSQVKITYVGYIPAVVDIKPGEHNEITVSLQEASTDLGEVVIRPGKYRRKNNPAVSLIEEVFAHKDQNRKEGLGFYSYEAYEKLELDINNITDKFRNRRALRKFQFIFENVDTNQTNGKVALPVYLRERLLNVYYRKNPKAEKEYISGEQQVGLEGYLDSDGISEYLNSMYQNVDIYDAKIMLLTNQFVGPLSAIAPTMYEFYIVDTVTYANARYVDIFFVPHNRQNLAFMGNMLVALDSTYAVRKVQMGISKNINLNWVSDLHIEQEFDFFGTGADRRLMLVKDEISMDFQVLKSAKGRSIWGHKSVSYKNYMLNNPLPDSIFRTNLTSIVGEKARQLPSSFWAERRHHPLSKTEAGIYRMVDSIQNVPAFRRTMDVATLLLAGYKTFNWFDLGPINTFYSFNAVEGFRLRAGGRTNPKLVKNLLLEGYAAYGFKDQKWKYFGGATYSFTKKAPMIFPINQMSVTYQNETQIPGESLQFVQEDNFLLSFKRGVNDKMIYNKSFRVAYDRELMRGLSYSLSFSRVIKAPGGALLFDYQLNDTGVEYKKQIITSSAGLSIRYAPNEKFYQGKTYRIPIQNKYPIMQLNFQAATKGLLSSEYNYQVLSCEVYKLFYLAPLGYATAILEGGRVFGTVPYPLLTIHRANQTFSYQLPAYNLMNFLEFASDKYVSLNIQQHFGGFFFNKVPLLRRLKWREVASFKGLYGGVDAKNRPSDTNGLLRFPVDNEGRTLTNTLENKPYIEVSAGIENIFKIFRVDYVRRMTYTHLPNVSKWGIRARFKIDF
jgi:Family of unknown function (DUF5686)/CarboxypepD_reg-like domain